MDWMDGWMDERNRVEQAMGSHGIGGMGQGATGEPGEWGMEGLRNWRLTPYVGLTTACPIL